MSDSNTTNTAMLSFLVGAAAGAAFAYLTAPQSGRRTRAQLREYFEEGRDSVRQLPEAAAQAKDAAAETFAEEMGRSAAASRRSKGNGKDDGAEEQSGSSSSSSPKAKKPKKQEASA